MLPNPYTPGALPAHLAGRGAHREMIRSHLARTREFGRSAGPLLAFYGSRGLGKTSLLRAAEHAAAEEGYLTIWVTGRDDAPMTPEVLYQLAAALRRRPLADRAREVLRQLERVQIELGTPGAKVGLQAGRSPVGGAATPASRALEENLAAAARITRAADKGPGAVLLVDELQEASLADRRSLLITLQHLDGAAESAPVGVIAAGLPALLAAIPEAATFGERSRFEPVGPLVDVAIAEALRVPAEALGVRWTDEAIVEVINITRGYPHHVQLLGEAAWNNARPAAAGTSINLPEVRFGQVRAAEDMERLFRSRWSKATAGQRRFRAAVADLDGDSVARADIVSRLDTDSRSLSQTRQNLLDRGFIESAGHGHIRFTIPGFGDFVLAEAEDAGLLDPTRSRPGLGAAFPS